ncbi:MAG: response regulator transcription factor [Verrucomicrobia bacterium]|nr:response regulator transcription factor [Verrucomicrobiota bacterium]
MTTQTPRSSEPATVFIVDDEPAVRKSLARLVRAAGYEVQAFASAREFLDRSNRDALGCIVLDVTMPDFTGLELQGVLTATRSILPIIFLTGHADVPKAVRALKGGAADFLSKPVQKDELLDAIDRAIRTNRVARAGLSRRAHDAEALRLLTAREYEVFVHVVTGKPNKVIAADLGTCEQTVKVHRGRVMQKLRVNSLAELVRLADRTGIRSAGAWTPQGGEGSDPSAGHSPPV